MSNIVNERIRKLREDRGYTQAELSDLVNIPRSTYAYRENHGKFTDDDLHKIADFFKVSYDSLIYDKEKSKQPIVIAHPDDFQTNTLNAPNLRENSLYVEITLREAEFIVNLRGLTEEQRREEFNRIETLNKINKNL